MGSSSDNNIWDDDRVKLENDEETDAVVVDYSLLK